ncbi:MAG TPA: Hsp20/alpha crystallin family protein [Burkholderiaceae bacterium]|nr:Hsp20/alpha crystallin family protein [Burkholderiaceae bacterium]
MSDKRNNQDITTATATSADTAPANATSATDTRYVVPRVDVLEDESGITLLADLPGVPKERLELKVDGDTLLVEGTVATATPPQLQSVYAEVRVPRYRRSFTLSRELDAGRIEAKMKDGVLNLRIPKQEHARPRRIEVRTG